MDKTVVTSRHDKLALRIFRSPQDIRDLCGDWLALNHHCGATQLMQQPDYYLSYAEHLAPGSDSVFIAGFFADDQLVAVLPLGLRKRHILGVELRVLGFPETPIPTRGFVASNGLTIKDLIGCLDKQFNVVSGQRWDILRFSGITQAIPEGPAVPGSTLSLSRTKTGKNNYLRLGDGDYVQTRLSANMRSNLKRRMKRLAKLGDVEYRTITALPELRAAFDAFVETEAAGWKGLRGGKRAIKLHPDQQAFYFDLLMRFARTGRAHIHLLELGGTAIAGDYCLVSGESAYSLKHGYDEKYADATPSNLLRKYTIEYYIEDKRVRYIDLISGYQWQDRWKPEHRDVISLACFNHTLKGRLLELYSRIRSPSDRSRRAWIRTD